MPSYRLLVHARRADALGVFYDHAFFVVAPEGASRDQLREAWFDKYGGSWSMHHIVSVVKESPADEPAP
jgi:hypothetical protein